MRARNTFKLLALVYTTLNVQPVVGISLKMPPFIHLSYGCEIKHSADTGNTISTVWVLTPSAKFVLGIYRGHHYKGYKINIKCI